MSEQDITVKIKTTADTSGAKKVENAIEAIVDVSKKRTDDGKLDTKAIVDGWMEEAKAAVGMKDKLGDVSDASEKLGKVFDSTTVKGLRLGGVGNVIKDLNNIAGSGAATMGLYFTAIAAAAKWSAEAVTESLDAHGKIIEEMEAGGRQVDEAYKLNVQSWQETLKPITFVIDGIKGAWGNLMEAVSNPVDFFSGAAEMREWNEKDKAFLEFAKNAQKEFNEARYQLKSTTAAEMYADEARQLEKHLALQEQINRARQEMGNVALARARNQVAIARQDGGDVAAAEANVVLVQLQTAITELSAEVGEARGGVEKAEQEMNAANMQLRIAVQENRPEEEIRKLEDIAKSKEDAFDIADGALRSQTALLKEKAALAGENAEIAMVDLQEEYKGGISAAAKKNFDAIKAKLEEVQGIASGETVGQIDALKTQVTNDQRASVEAVKAVGAESTKASQQAARDTVQAVNEVGTANAAQWATLTAALRGVKNQINTQQQQINQILAR
jgi:hypothetical protein